MTEKNNRTGKFIVFEGLDGSGKTKHIGLLKEHLVQRGRRIHVTTEPTNSQLGGMLRDALSGITQRSPCEMAALFLLDRIFHNLNPVSGINKMLSDGYDVICDRYYYSSLAYQGTETDFDWVLAMNINCPEIRRPDLCIFLDLDPDICIKRLQRRTTTDIYETKERLEKYRAAYFRVFDLLDDRVIVVNTADEIVVAAEKIAKAADDICNIT